MMTLSGEGRVEHGDNGQDGAVTIAGLVLLILGVALAAPIVYLIGGVLLALGIFAYVMGRIGTPVGPLKHYY